MDNHKIAAGYSHSERFDDGRLPVSDLHTLSYSQYGKPDGLPVIFLHGGPGGQTSKSNTVFFNPTVYRVILFDQRGSGRSTPLAEIRENTSAHLVADIETLRKYLEIPKWHMVFGGSWGSTLSLLYAQTHPSSVGSMVLRGIYTARKQEMEWSRGRIGAAKIYPDAYETYLAHLDPAEQEDPISGYYKLVTSEDSQVRLAAAREWNRWDITIGALELDAKSFSRLDDDDWCLTHARMESHYWSHGAWLEDGQLLREENLAKIKHIPTTIIQGRYDIICHPQTAWDLHKAWPETKLHWISGAGHGVSERGMTEKLTEVCDEYGRLEII